MHRPSAHRHADPPSPTRPVTARRFGISACCAVLLAAFAWQDVAPAAGNAPPADDEPPTADAAPDPADDLPVRPAPPLVDGVLALAPADWWLDGRPLELGDDGQPLGAPGSVSLDGPVLLADPVAPRAEGDLVELTFYTVGGSWPRWSTVFSTPDDDAFMARLSLEWEGGPGGALFEVVLDGRRLSPPRDAWRPTDRPLVSDLGPAWLGPGRHLLEFVLRERSVPSTLRLRRLHAERLGPRAADAAHTDPAHTDPAR